MCKGKENNFVGEYIGKTFTTIIDANGNKVEAEDIEKIKIKIEKVGVGAYKCIINYYINDEDDEDDGIIILGFKDNNNTIVSSSASGTGIVYIYFDGNKLRHKVSFIIEDNDTLVRVSELKRVKNNDCSCHHSHHGNCCCKH